MEHLQSESVHRASSRLLKLQKERILIKLPIFYTILINIVINAVSLYPLLSDLGPFTLLLCAWSIIALLDEY